jgi:Circadian oscillating protein COP23
MRSQTLKFLFFSGLGLSIFLGNSVAMAQINSGSDGIVVPTTSGGSTSTSTQTQTNTSTINSSTPISSDTRFSCQYYNGQYTVMYQPESSPGQFFPWASPRTLGGGWDAESRCNKISERLESYRPDGLVELQTGVQNRQNIVCVTTEAVPGCRIVLTVPPEKDPYVVRNSIFQNLASADNGENTIAVNTYGSQGNELYNFGRTLLGGKNPSRVSSSRDPINLKPFLDRKDGGNATKLRNGVAIRKQTNTTTTTKTQTNVQTNGRRLLNPDKFR